MAGDGNGYTLSGPFVQRLTRLLRWWESRGADGTDPQYGPRGQILPPPPWKFGKLDAQLNTNSSVNCSVYTLNNTNNTWTDTTDNLTAYAPPLLSSGNIASGKWVKIEYHLQAQRWYVTSAEC